MRKWLLLLMLSLLPLAWGQLEDRDGDGYPDTAELSTPTERRSFLTWFAAIAEAQYTAPATDWTERDCSGLLRYAFVEALKRKDAAWLAKFPYLPPLPEAPVSRYPLPAISRSVFRNAPGPFRTDDVAEGRLVGMANAEHLMRFSSTFLGRREGGAVRGDLLFFAHPLSQGSGFHSMVYLGQGRVVYHTGLSPEAGGEVRLLNLATLRRHPDSSWHPDPENPHFLGFFRWNIAL
jgi:uncharacterized protein YfaT (DUF1175 family)